MRISETWLKEWIDPILSREDLAARLSMAGLEVEACTPVAAAFTSVVVAEVIQTKPHPQADRLTLCEVSTGEATYPVVCGAANVRKGLKVALALLGAKLPGDFVIKEAKLRGEVSKGMLCSASELGIEEQSDGILELPEDAPLGTDIRNYLDLDDHVIEIDITPNRADCFSVLGIAREVFALTRAPLKPLSIPTINIANKDTVAVEVEATDACPYYSARIIRNINPHATTPLWMVERLRRSGLRAIHPVVDVTNYVMLELGQPLHAFDLKVINQGIVVRKAKDHESITLLNGQKVTLTPAMLVIADSEKPLALAGIMGGQHSAVNEKTTDIVLESAFFAPMAIAGVGRQFGVVSDSSMRFERGVDPNLASIAMDYATELLLKIVSGDASALTIHKNEAKLPSNPVIQFDPRSVEKLCGVSVSVKDMKQHLEALGMKVSEKGDFFDVIPPSHRFDIALNVDLVEEIVRLHGYDNIQATTIASTIKPGHINAQAKLARKISLFLMARGYHETISYSFVDPALQQALSWDSTNLQLKNPISPELSVMRQSLWPGLIASCLHNFHRQQTTMKAFEIGVVFEPQAEDVVEVAKFGVLLSGDKGHLHWAEQSRTYDFFDSKGDIEALLQHLHLQKIECVASSHEALHPGKSAEWKVNGVTIGWLGALHPKIAEALNFDEEILVGEFRLDALHEVEKPRYTAISKYPQIRRDLSFIIDESIAVAAIEKTITDVVSSDLLKSFDIFDVYIGEGIPKGKKSIALSITLQDTNKTLVDDQINSIVNAIIKSLQSNFSIILRE